MAALCSRRGHYIFVLWFLLLSSFFVAYSQSSQIGCLPYFHTWCGLSVNLGCRSETCCIRIAGNTGRKNSPKIRNLGTIAQFCRVVSSQIRHISTIGKNLLNSSTLLHTSLQYGELWTTNGWDRFDHLGHPANFNWFLVLAALLHGI